MSEGSKSFLIGVLTIAPLTICLMVMTGLEFSFEVLVGAFAIAVLVVGAVLLPFGYLFPAICSVDPLDDFKSDQ